MNTLAQANFVQMDDTLFPLQLPQVIAVFDEGNAKSQRDTLFSLRMPQGQLEGRQDFGENVIENMWF